MALKVSPPVEVNGILVDLDVTKKNDEGGAAQWLQSR